MKPSQFLTAVFLLTAFRAILPAQSTLASITGVVTDPNGAVVAGATIEATNIATGYKYTAKSNEAGQYTLTGLLNGTYSMRATAAGFADFTADNIILAERDQRRIDVSLNLGAVQTKVDVTGAASLIETETARIADVKNHEIMWLAPLALHRSTDLFQMAPMTVHTNTSPWRVGGSRNHQSEIAYDGISAASSTGGAVNGVFSDRTESYQEMSVEVAGGSAEFSTVGQISVVTRGGTNQIHGSAFDVYITPGLSARNPFSPANTASLYHQPGGSVGGPVYIPRVYDGRNRTFFFTSIEFEQLGGPSSHVTVLNPTVPLAAWRTGDFSGLLPGTVVRDPFGGNTPFPNNMIPQSRLNPVAVAVQNQFYPLPNFGDPNVLAASNYRDTIRSPDPPSPTAVLRMDHKLSDSAWLSFHTTQTYWDQGPDFIGPLPAYGTPSVSRRISLYGATFTKMITPGLVTETRYGYVAADFPQFGVINGLQQVKQFGLTGLAPNLPDLTGTYAVNWSGLGLTPIGGSYQISPNNFSPVHNGQQSVNWFRGKHAVKAGFQIRRNDVEDYRATVGLFGNDTFSNRFTGFPYADFLLGIPTTAARTFPPIKKSVYNYAYAAFIQDQYRITPKLTLNYGLRWDYKAPWQEANGYLSVFDPKTGKIVVPDVSISKVNPLMPANYIGVISASDAGYPKNLINASSKEFGPRIGVAWRPLGNNTVFRAGFGIYYDNYLEMPTQVGVPFSLTEPAFTNPANNPTVILPQVFPSTGTGAPDTVAIPSAINPNVREPYTIQYNATVEHQFENTAVSLSFVSTGSREVVYGYDLNQPVPSTQLYINKPRPFPNYPNINYFTNGAGHQWRAGTIQIKRAFTNGLMYQAYYTLARDIGDVDNDGVIEDAFNRRRERKPMPDQPTHRFYVNMIYAVPVGKGKRFLSNSNWLVDALVGGWQISNIFVHDGGYFLTPLWTGPDPTNTRYTSNSTPPTVTLRPNIVSNPNLSNPTPAQWFNTAAFSAPSPGAFGTSAGGVIIGPGLTMLSSGLQKYFSIGERARLRIDLLAANTLNHLGYLANPALDISNAATAGTITGISNVNLRGDNAGPRQVQINVRLEW